MPNKKGVIINIYKESTTLRSNNKTDPIKKINPKLSSSQPRVSKTRGYNRRAQLLAYAQELRHSHAEKLQLPFKNSTAQREKWRWALAVQKIRVLFSRVDGIKRKWRYEPIVTEDYINEEPYCDQGRMKRKKGNRRRHFCRKLKCFLKRMSKLWKCKNGGC